MTLVILFQHNHMVLANLDPDLARNTVKEFANYLLRAEVDKIGDLMFKPRVCVIGDGDAVFDPRWVVGMYTMPDAKSPDERLADAVERQSKEGEEWKEDKDE